MKFTHHAATALVASEGSSGIPSWRRTWIENQVRMVLLECGHTEDISVAGITFINTFEGSSIDCVKCGRFVAVMRALKSKRTPVKSSDTPMF